MKKLKIILLILIVGMSAIGAKAQIGYQIALLNTATGEPRINETVTVSVSLSNNAGEVFYSETKSATTNDFGILSLSVGNADTFKDVDLTKMPFFIEVSANGVMIGKSQMLSVPVSEVAKRMAPIDKKLIVGTHYVYYDTEEEEWSRNVITFNNDNTGTIQWQYKEDNDIYKGDIRSFTYGIDGNRIYLFRDGKGAIQALVYYNGKLYQFDD